MILSRITLRNWLSFRGTHTVDLGPTIYGVTARLESDEARSNWLGKSSLLGAARFALYGSFSHLGGCEREGDWITRGEDEGGVRVELDDGTVVDRRRGRGTATELAARIAGVASKGDRAAELLLRHVGLSEDDFCTVSYLEQKKLARVVTDMRPSDRQEVVSSWLMLGPLRLAEERERKSLAALRAREERLVASAETLERVHPASAPSEEDVGRAAARAAELLAEYERLSAEHARAIEALAARRAEAEFDRTRDFLREEIAREEGASVETSVPPLVTDLSAAKERAKEAAGALRLAAAETLTRKRVASGAFDGRCPIAAVACPIDDRINSMRAENAAAAEKAERAEKAARLADQRGSRELLLAEEAERGARERAARLGEMRRRLASMDEQAARRVLHETTEPAKEIGDRTRAIRAEAAAADEEARRLARDREAASRHAREIESIEEELARVRAEAATSREAIAILGRNGAQRRLAREALASIESRANDRLASAGIDLRMTFDWGRPTAKPAEECHACGLPFPSSARVKECACGAERGKKVEDGLWVRLSYRSGAAEDLAGFALGVAAGEWLREERGAQWAVLFADEPFGALDAAHRRALAASVARLLTPGGYRQALVVAHHPGLMDGLPGRIRIASDGANSRLDV